MFETMPLLYPCRIFQKNRTHIFPLSKLYFSPIRLGLEGFLRLTKNWYRVLQVCCGSIPDRGKMVGGFDTIYDDAFELIDTMLQKLPNKLVTDTLDVGMDANAELDCKVGLEPFVGMQTLPCQADDRIDSLFAFAQRCAQRMSSSTTLALMRVCI